MPPSRSTNCFVAPARHLKLLPIMSNNNAERCELIELLDHCSDQQRREILQYARQVVAGGVYDPETTFLTQR